MSHSAPWMSSPPKACAAKSIASGPAAKQAAVPTQERCDHYPSHRRGRLSGRSHRRHGHRPGHIRTIIQNDVPHPREYQSPAFLNAWFSASTMSSPRNSCPMCPRKRRFRSRPPADSRTRADSGGQSWPRLRTHGNRPRSWRPDRCLQTRLNLPNTISATRSPSSRRANCSDFLDTPKNQVLLTDIGRRFLDADINGRKTIFRESDSHPRNLPLCDASAQGSQGQSPSARISSKKNSPSASPPRTWKRHSTPSSAGADSREFFGYDASSEELFLDPEPSNSSQ